MDTIVKSLAEFIDAKSQAVIITELTPELVKEIQYLLKIDVDGIPGEETKTAFADFKRAKSLQYPLALGLSTAKELLELKDKEDDLENDLVKYSHTGNFMFLPDGKKVYQDDLVINGIPLTWGELTKNCTRIPTSQEYVANAIKLTKTWGWVRDKFNSPLTITSAYRPPAVNKSQGGARNSQHVYFRAIDMIPINGDFKKLWEVLEDSPFTGLGDAVFRGKNKGFFHADIRPGGRVVFAY